MIALYRFVLRPYVLRPLGLRLLILGLTVQVLALEAWVLVRMGWAWLYLHRPVRVYTDGPVFDHIHVTLLETEDHYWAFYVARDRTGTYYDRWPHISIFRDNG